MSRRGMQPSGANAPTTVRPDDSTKVSTVAGGRTVGVALIWKQGRWQSCACGDRDCDECGMYYTDEISTSAMHRWGEAVCAPIEEALERPAITSDDYDDLIMDDEVGGEEQGEDEMRATPRSPSQQSVVCAQRRDGGYSSRTDLTALFWPLRPNRHQLMVLFLADTT